MSNNRKPLFQSSAFQNHKNGTRANRFDMNNIRESLLPRETLIFKSREFPTQEEQKGLFNDSQNVIENAENVDPNKG